MPGHEGLCHTVCSTGIIGVQTFVLKVNLILRCNRAGGMRDYDS